MHKTRKEIDSLNKLFNDFEKQNNSFEKDKITEVFLSEEEIIELTMKLLGDGYKFEIKEQETGNEQKDIFISFDKKAS